MTQNNQLYEQSDTTNMNNSMVFDLPDEDYVEYEGENNCDAATGCGQIKNGTSADEKLGL